MATYPTVSALTDLRYNPFDDTYAPRGYGYDGGVPPENRDIPAVSPYFIPLFEYPIKEIPSSIQIIDVDTSTTLTEVDETTSPGNNQYRVHYEGDRAGLIEFNASQSGHEINISYYGLGHNVTTLPVQAVKSEIETNYGTDTNFGTGLAGGSGTKELEQCGKRVYNKYREAAQFILGLAGGSGTSEAEKWGKEVLNKYGIYTDWTTGQGGAAGSTELQKLGNLMLSQVVTENLKSRQTGTERTIVSDKYASSLTMTDGQWVNILTCPVDAASKRFSFIVQIVCSSMFYSSSFLVSGLILESSGLFLIDMLQLGNKASATVNYGKARIISSNDTTARGQYLQIEFPVGTTTPMEVIIRGATTGSAWTYITPEVWTSGNLPSGAAYATYGQASPLFYRYSVGDHLNFIVGLGGSDDETVHGKEGKAVLEKYGVDTDWTTGNNGTAGTNEIQGAGYAARAGIKTAAVISATYGSYRSAMKSGTVTKGNWVTIAEIAN